MDPQKNKIKMICQTAKFINKASYNRKMYHQNCTIKHRLIFSQFLKSQLCGFTENDPH